jgi:glutathione S-transferase
MARLRIYGVARTRAFRVLWMAEELGLDYEHIVLETGPAGASRPDYLAVNPNGRLPAIDDDGFILWESLAINIYLAKKHATGTLYPATPQGEAKATQWSLWAANEIERATNVWSFHAERLPEPERDPAIVAAALQLLASPYRVLDQALSGHSYLLGDDFTVADLNVGAVALRARAMDLSATPHFAAWLERCYQRPAAQKVSRWRSEAEAGASLDATREAARRNRL